MTLLDQPTCLGIAEGDDGIAGYAIRMSGALGGLLSDGEFYPDLQFMMSNSGKVYDLIVRNHANID